MTVRRVRPIPPCTELRHDEAREARDAGDGVQIKGRASRNVIPAEHQVTVIAQAVVTLGEGAFALGCAVETPTQNAIADDEVEKIGRKVSRDFLERGNHMLIGAEPAKVWIGFDGPVVAAGEEFAFVVGGVGVAADEQDGLEPTVGLVEREDDLLEHTPVFGVEGRMQTELLADYARCIALFGQQRPDAAPSALWWFAHRVSVHARFDGAARTLTSVHVHYSPLQLPTFNVVWVAAKA